MNPLLGDGVLVAASCVIFAVYLRTLSASIAGGDSGEIVAEGCHLGTAHPPGYPLITMLIYAISGMRNEGSVAFHVNCFCSLCTSTAALALGCMVKKVNKNTTSSAGAVLAMGMFAFSPLIWQYAITAEVFPLNTMLAAIILFLVVHFSDTSQLWVAYLGAFICGIALCNQHTIVLFEAPLILWMLFLLRTHILKHPAVFVNLSACFIIGLLPYAYLPIAATIAPKQGSWGHVSTLQGFLHHILRRDYGTFQLFSGAEGKSAEGFWARNEAFLTDFVDTQASASDVLLGNYMGVTCIVLVVLGIVSALTQISVKSSSKSTPVAKMAATKAAAPGSAKNSGNKSNTSTAVTTQDTTTVSTSTTSTENAIIATAPAPVSLILSATECSWTPTVLFLTLVFYFAVFHTLSNLPLKDRLLYGVHQRFWMQPNIIMFLFLGVGVDAFMHWLATFFVGLCTPLRNTTGKASTTAATSKTTTGDNNSASVVRIIMSVLSFALAGAVVYVQYASNVPMMDMSNNTHFRDYATAVLAPLPLNSILLINYDQQWTSVRYLQQCEGYRTDITALQLSMMTYPWFEHKRHLYPSITFPGTYHTYPGSSAQKHQGAFTLRQFLDANIPNKHIYLGGKLSYSDPQISTLYETVPEGMVSRFVALPANPVKPYTKLWSSAESTSSDKDTADRLYRDFSAANYVAITHASWGAVSAKLAVSNLPDLVQYPMETWEWTIGRDYKDRVTDTAAYMLQKALDVEATDVQPLIEAIYWLESAYLLETLNATTQRAAQQQYHGAAYGAPAINVDVRSYKPDDARCASHLLKNTGLAYVHLVRNTLLTSFSLPAPLQDTLRTLASGLLQWPDKENWKLWSSNRFVFFWGEFLSHPDAKLDSQYGAILNMYETATKRSSTTSSGNSGTNSGGKGGGASAKGSKAKGAKA